LFLEDSLRRHLPDRVSLKRQGENCRLAEHAPSALYVHGKRRGEVKKLGGSSRGSVQIDVARKFFLMLTLDLNDAYGVGAHPRLRYGGEEIFHLPKGPLFPPTVAGKA